MKFGLIAVFLVLFVCADAQTYRAGGSSRPSFGGRSAEEAEESSAPGANSSIKTRTFSNYSARQRDWSKGVQTQTVKTETAGSKDFQDTAAAQADQAANAIKSMTGGSAAQAAANPASKPDTAAQPTAKDSSAQQQQAAAPGQDPTAMLEQMKGMLQGLGGGASAGGNSAAGGNSSAGGAAMPAGLNVPGMPDMSALLNAAAAGQQPGK